MILLDLFLATSGAELESLDDETSAQVEGARKFAAKFLQSWYVSLWTEQQNEEKRWAPSSGTILDQFEACRAALPSSARSRALGAAARASARKELSR